MNRLSIFAFIALTLFLATGRQSGVDGLFFGSDAQEDEDDGEPPEEAHDLPHLDPHPDDNLTVGADGFDQKAFLGSEEEAQLYTGKDREEQEKMLRALIPKMDEDGNGAITKTELTKWIAHSVNTLKNQEAKNRFADHDYNEDGKFGWNDHLYSVFGFEPSEEELKKGIPGAEDTKEEHEHQLELFRVADVDHNKELSYEEFKAFFRPEDYPHTQELEIKNILRQFDADKDGGLNLNEFIKAELHDDDDKEWIKIETDRFNNNWDKNKDGVLKGAEIVSWWMPSNDEVAREETEHLFGVADDNKDAQLSVDEIIKHLDTFAGSQATNYGQHFKDEL